MSVQHGQVGNFKVLDLLDSAVLEDGQVQLEPVQIGVAGQPLASELGWFDECSWLLWQICKVAR